MAIWCSVTARPNKKVGIVTSSCRTLPFLSYLHYKEDSLPHGTSRHEKRRDNTHQLDV